MSLVATNRYSMPNAPTPLNVIQDFLNTVSAGRTVRGPDLLGTVEDANEWLQGLRTLDESIEPPHLEQTDLEPLRRLRSAVADALSSHAGEAGSAATTDLPTVPVELALGPDGVRVRPRGRGWKWVAGVVLRDLHDAQVDGSARRLKVCPNEWCHVAFFDRSKNNSAIWHDSASCGNIVNVRASRARKRTHHAKLAAN